MSEELLLNDRRVEQNLTKLCPLGYQPLVAMLQPIFFYWQQAVLRGESNRDHSKMKNESVKKSLEKSKNVLEKCKNGQAKNLHKNTNTFTIITMNFVKEQLNYYSNN